MKKLNEQLACVSREIGMRHRVYPNWVRKGKMSQTVADHEIACMNAVLATLLQVQKERDNLL